MRRDETIFLLGEDVAEAGTPFKILSGLVEEFGTDRIVDTPIAEPGFMGIAVGAAMTGSRPASRSREMALTAFIPTTSGTPMEPVCRRLVRVGSPSRNTSHAI